MRKPGRDSPGCRRRLRWGAAGPHFGWMILGLNELNNVRKRSGERQPLVSRLLTGFLSQQDNTLWSPGMIISDKNYRGFLLSNGWNISFPWPILFLDKWLIEYLSIIAYYGDHNNDTLKQIQYCTEFVCLFNISPIHMIYITDPINYQQAFSSFKYLWWPVDTDE